MQFDNSFDVPLPPAQAWAVLMDIERIAPCMPGAELTEVARDNTYKGRISVRLGPVALTFAGVVKFVEIDEANRTARITAQGTDAKGRGGASAEATFRLESGPGGSTVRVRTDLTLSGAVVQYGRGAGVIQATAAQLIKQFADCLRAELSAGKISAQAAAREPPAKPIAGFSLMARVIWDAIVRWFRRR